MDWKKVKIGELLTESKIESLNPSSDKRIKVRLNVKGVEKRAEKNEVEGATKQYSRKAGQFIYGKQNFHKGAFGIIPKELDGFESSSDIPSFDVSTDCLVEWIFYFFKEKDRYLDLEKLATGVGSKRISPSKFFNIEIPLPEIEQQKSLILKIKNSEEKQCLVQEQIITQKTYLKNLRKQILQDAIEGKLTKEWREQNPNIEPASELLKKIKKEKEKLITEKKIKKEKPLPPIEKNEVPFELPSSWIWTRIGEITNYGSSEKIEPNRITDDTWVLDLEDIEKESSKIINFETFKNRNTTSSKSVFKKGDVLYSKLRPYLDKVVVAPGDGICTTEIIPIKMFAELNPLFFMYNLKRRDFLDYASRCVKGMKMPRFGTEDVKLSYFPLPPLSEQLAIVSKLQTLMQKLDEAEKQIEKSLETSKLLTKAILAEAFKVHE